jgi:hypothetical protein
VRMARRQLVVAVYLFSVSSSSRIVRGKLVHVRPAARFLLALMTPKHSGKPTQQWWRPSGCSGRRARPVPSHELSMRISWLFLSSPPDDRLDLHRRPDAES